MKTKLLIIAFCALFISACGGGNSSSGGGSNNSGPSGANTSALAGTYVGTVVLVVNGLGQTESDTFKLVVTVSNNGEIFLYFEGSVLASGPVSAAGVFSISDNVKNIDIDLDQCSGQLVVAGNVAGNKVTGTVSSRNVECLFSKVTVSGNFNATKS
ncbi:MAG: hypothetical protein ACI8P9_005293 [Parasphingorhabdus sp.]|jgi:hypothetical protein